MKVWQGRFFLTRKGLLSTLCEVMRHYITESKSDKRPEHRTKQEEVLVSLRQEIVSGKLKPGKQLPTRGELERRFNVSTITVQRALDCLVEDGFVSATRSKGTFVVDHPPHLSRYALVLPFRESHEPWGRFWTALVNEARRLEIPGQREVPVFFDELGHLDSEDYQALLQDVKAHRLAGAIVVQHSAVLQAGSALRDSGLPLVALNVNGSQFGVPQVEADEQSFVAHAVEHFRAAGRRRIALLTLADGSRDLSRAERSRLGLEKAGLECPAHWALSVDRHYPWTVQPMVQLLMHGDQKAAPEGLLVADDNLVEYAAAGLVVAGVNVPQDLEVVVHCNFPWPTPSVLPVKRLGYDTRRIMQTCLSLIDRQRRGERVALQHPITAVFEDEAVAQEPLRQRATESPSRR